MVAIVSRFWWTIAPTTGGISCMFDTQELLIEKCTPAAPYAFLIASRTRISLACRIDFRFTHTSDEAWFIAAAGDSWHASHARNQQHIERHHRSEQCNLLCVIPCHPRLGNVRERRVCVFKIPCLYPRSPGCFAPRRCNTKALAAGGGGLELPLTPGSGMSGAQIRRLELALAWHRLAGSASAGGLHRQRKSRG